MQLPSNETLINHIQDEIKKSNGYISFARFMELALYTPSLGYYMKDLSPLGEKGDFVTAPEISPLFAQCIAKQGESIATELKTFDIVEFGAGSGIFAKHLLLALEKSGNLPLHYYIIEMSPARQRQQKKLFETECPHLLSRIIWQDKLLENTITGIIFANEVMDALPTHCFRIEKNTIKEKSVTWENNRFDWKLTTPTPLLQKKIQALQKEIIFPDDYESEINLMLADWITMLGKALKQGVILLADYGYGRSEYYHPDRSRGTLMCFFEHHRSENPFEKIGLQDMTSHVDFTAVAENAVATTLSLAGYTTQTQFLIGCGLFDLIEKNKLSPIEHYQQMQAVKILTLPSEMGELIKVMGLTKEWHSPLMGFNISSDRRQHL